MIGRAAQGRPWIFRESWRMIAGHAQRLPEPGEVRDILLGHVRELYEFYGSEPGVRIARKHLGWYCTGRPHAQAFRGSVMQATAAEQQFELVRNYFDALEASAAAAAA